MKSITFYSYKGGVGRTLTLSNMAKKLCDLGIDVFVLDFDLEAPGLTYKLKGEINNTPALEKKGLVDYITYFQENDQVPKDFTEYYSEINPSGNGKLYLMTAGQFSKPSYWNKLSSINWVELFKDGGNGVPLLLDLKGRIEKQLKPAYLLIDSRTGVTASASITLKLLADKCVVLAINNEENLDGAKTVLKSLLTLRQNIRPELNFVLTRIPYHDNKLAELAREKGLLWNIQKSTFSELDTSSFNYFGVIHHERELGWKEVHRLGLPIEKKDFLTLDYLELFNSLFSEISNSKSKGSKLEKERQIAELIEKALSEKSSNQKLDLLNEALALDPGYWQALFHRIMLYLDLRKFNEALIDCKAWVKHNPQDYWGYLFWGYTFEEWAHSTNDEKLYSEAISKYKTALELNPTSPIAFESWGGALIKMAKYKSPKEGKEYYNEAVTKFEKAIELDQNYSEAYYNLGKAFIDIGHLSSKEKSTNFFNKALEVLQKARNLGGKAYNLSCIYAILGDKQNALKNLEISLNDLEITPNMVVQDKDWQNLKGDPDFEAMLAKYKNLESKN